MKKNFIGKTFFRGAMSALMLVMCAGATAQDSYNLQLPAGGPDTPENRLIKLRDAMEDAVGADKKAYILQEIGKTGTFQGMMYAGKYIDNQDLGKAAAQGVDGIQSRRPAGRHIAKYQADAHRNRKGYQHC